GIDDRAAGEDVDDRVPVAVDHLLGERAAQVLQDQRVALDEPGDARRHQASVDLGDRAEIAVGRYEVDGLARRDADPGAEDDACIAEDVDLAAAGDPEIGRAVIEGGRGCAAAGSSDDVDGAVVLEDLVAGGADSGAAPGHRPVHGRRAGGGRV